MNWLNGTAAAYTSAPWTGRLPHAVIFAVMLNVPTCLPSTCGFELNVTMLSRAGAESWLIWIVPLPDGQPVGAGAAGFAVTTAVGTEVSEPEPSAFFARHTHTKGVTDVSAAKVVEAPVGTADPGTAAAVLVAALVLVRVGGRAAGPLAVVGGQSRPSCGVPLIVGGVVLLGAALDAARPRPAVPKTAPMTTADDCDEQRRGGTDERLPGLMHVGIPLGIVFGTGRTAG